jgi:hypothetical protein
VDVVAALLIALALGAAAVFVTAPVRRRRAAEAGPETSRAALEAAKEAKYREIRDAELDYRTGKLSEDDFRALDASLRAEAVEILTRLDELDGSP